MGVDSGDDHEGERDMGEGAIGKGAHQLELPLTQEVRCVDCRKVMRPGYQSRWENCGRVYWLSAWALCEECEEEH